MSPDNSDHREPDNRRCDDCNYPISALEESDPLTVQWANVIFCSHKCRDRWTQKAKQQL